MAELHWPATLLSGCSETASDVTFQTLSEAKEAGPFLSTRMDAWSKRSFAAKALAAVGEDLAESARRTALRAAESSVLSTPPWALNDKTTRSDLNGRCFRLTCFPEPPFFCSYFERVPQSFGLGAGLGPRCSGGRRAGFDGQPRHVARLEIQSNGIKYKL